MQLVMYVFLCEILKYNFYGFFVTSKVRSDTVVVSLEEIIQEVTHVSVDIVIANTGWYSVKKNKVR